MFTFFESSWPLVSFLLLLVLIITLIFFPSSTGTFSTAMLILGDDLYLSVLDEKACHADLILENALLRQ